jgi:hypothetical protein
MLAGAICHKLRLLPANGLPGCAAITRLQVLGFSVLPSLCCYTWHGELLIPHLQESMLWTLTLPVVARASLISPSCLCCSRTLPAAPTALQRAASAPVPAVSLPQAASTTASRACMPGQTLGHIRTALYRTTSEQQTHHRYLKYTTKGQYLYRLQLEIINK